MIKKILDIISAYVEAPRDSFDENTAIFDLGVDSLRMLKIIIDVEEMFGVRFEDNEIVDIKTAYDIENFVLEKIQ